MLDPFQLRKLDKDEAGKIPVRAARRIIARFLPTAHSAVDTRELVKLAAADSDGRLDTPNSSASCEVYLRISRVLLTLPRIARPMYPLFPLAVFNGELRLN